MTATAPPVAALLDRTADHRALAPLRVAIGPLMVAQLWPAVRAANPGEVFAMPYASWWPAPPPGLVVPLLWFAMAAAVAVSLGWHTRVAAAATAFAFAWWMLSDDLRYHHNRGLLLVLVVLVALTRSGGTFSVDAIRDGGGTVGMLWPILLARFEIALMYLVSGGSKLLDPDWVGGTVTWLRVEAGAGPGPHGWLVGIATDPGFHRVAAPVIVATELLIGAGLLAPRLRPAAIWLAVPFHVAIEVGAEVQTFSYAALVALVVWVTPTPERHLLALPGGHGAVRWAVRWLDWTGRLAVTGGGREPTLVSPDGAERRGGAAVAKALALLPVSFWPAVPWSAGRTVSRPPAPATLPP